MSFREMAERREEEASTLSDLDVWTTIVSKFVLLDQPVDMRIAMMLSALGEDKNLLLEALEACVDRGMITEVQYKSILNELD